MALIYGHQKDLVLAAANDIKDMLHPENEDHKRLVQKGLMLYRQGLVHRLKVIREKVMATVQDVTPVLVSVDLNSPWNSVCSCPSEDFCRHRLAVFFQAYSQAASVSDWIEDWRAPIKEKDLASQLGLMKAKDLLKTSTRLDHDYDKWTAAFTGSFNSIVKGNGSPSPFVIPELFRIYLRRIRADAPVEQEWKNLYDLVSALHSFSLLAGLSESERHSEETVNRYYRFLFHSLTEEAEAVLQKLAILSLPFAFDVFIKHIKEEAIRLLEGSELFEYERIGLYRLLWSKLLRNNAWRDAERNRLEKFRIRSFEEDLALAHHYFLARKDKNVIDVVSGREEKAFPYTLYWIEVLSEHKEWSRMAPYADYFAHGLRPYLSSLGSYYARSDFARLALKVLTPFCTDAGRTDLLERVMVQALPYSFVSYEEFLFDRKMYDKWAELYTFAGIDFQAVSTARIKTVQKEAPVVLLPLYHQAVEYLISQKNRGSYKQAVRVLKKLRTIYKKLKRVPEWEAFFALLLERTKRLRAFQEECKRSKLIEEESAIGVKG
ncbi:SWIM zinc finger family protein [Bacillus sp. T33-2]|uniref:SWIM zinc finger family protein n=1 Tax=Bacillus sp. T33-2 TaxID=2054168 RepID=UPI000C78C659|nr:SWIM zinc finger family protein [Bacillus sp. T33-2]PLR94478.1 hypothetical protein CVD19_17480 [Bacillus sp. T33-2]